MLCKTVPEKNLPKAFAVQNVDYLKWNSLLCHQCPRLFSLLLIHNITIIIKVWTSISLTVNFLCQRSNNSWWDTASSKVVGVKIGRSVRERQKKWLAKRRRLVRSERTGKRQTEGLVERVRYKEWLEMKENKRKGNWLEMKERERGGVGKWMWCVKQVKTIIK